MTSWQYLDLLFKHLADVVAIFMVLVILSTRREARATVGWLLLVLFVPYLGAFLYVLLGRRLAAYPPPKPEEPDPTAPCPLPAGGLSPRMALTQRLTGEEPVTCRELKLFTDAREKYDHLFADIEGARERVVVCYYVFRNDATGHRLLELLARKAEAGVEVRVLFDGWGAIGLALFGRLGRYRRRGVRIVPFARVIHPLKMSRLNFRNHRKIVVVDGRVAYTGSTNIGDEYLGLDARHGVLRDLHVRLTGGAATRLERVFAGDWKIATGERYAPPPAPAAPGAMPIHVLATGPDQEEDRLYPLLFAQLTRAERSIDIFTPYLVLNQGLIAALAVAARQGVRVRVLLPQRSNHPLVAAAGRSYYEELLESGVEIYETPAAMLHAKGIVVDEAWVMVGSANFDNRSFFLNFEVNIALSDDVFVDRVGNLFDRWANAANRVSLARMRARPAHRRLFDAVCRTLSPVL